MLADGANFRSVGANYDMTAVAAGPDLVAVARENEAVFNISQKSLVSFFVMLFNLANHAEFGSDLSEALLLGGLGHFGIHVGPFIMLAGGSIRKIGGSVGNIAAVEIFKPEFCMLFLVGSCLFENGSYLLISVFACFRGIV